MTPEQHVVTMAELIVERAALQVQVEQHTAELKAQIEERGW